MWDINELLRHRDVVDQLDWDMTPEKAIETYLEWGTGWSRKGDFVRYAGQESYYFVVYDWEQPPQVTLVRRDTAGMEELAGKNSGVDCIDFIGFKFYDHVLTEGIVNILLVRT